MRKLRSLGADEHLSDVCDVVISDDDSQVVPRGKTGFRRGHCTRVNLEVADVQDEVEAVTSVFHESLHANDIAANGEDGVSRENEIDAHYRTIEFLRDWKKREPTKAKRIDEEIEEERESVNYLSRHGD